MNIFQALEKQKPNSDWELVVGMPEGPDTSFSPHGCDLIDTLACDVYDVKCALFKRNIFGRIIEEQHFDAQVCGEVLDAMANGTNYYLNERGDWIPEWDFVDEDRRRA